MRLLFRLIDNGQRVTVAGHTGALEEIGLFATTLLTPDNETTIVPDLKTTDDSIVNYARRCKVRANVSIGVAYGSDIATAMQVTRKASAEFDLVLADPALACGTPVVPCCGGEA